MPLSGRQFFCLHRGPWIELDGEDTFRMYYEGALDVETGGRLPGEYYDVYKLQ